MGHCARIHSHKSGLHRQVASFSLSDSSGNGDERALNGTDGNVTVDLLLHVRCNAHRHRAHHNDHYHHRWSLPSNNHPAHSSYTVVSARRKCNHKHRVGLSNWLWTSYLTRQHANSWFCANYQRRSMVHPDHSMSYHDSSKDGGLVPQNSDSACWLHRARCGFQGASSKKANSLLACVYAGTCARSHPVHSCIHASPSIWSTCLISLEFWKSPCLHCSLTRCRPSFSDGHEGCFTSHQS